MENTDSLQSNEKGRTQERWRNKNRVSLEKFEDSNTLTVLIATTNLKSSPTPD